MTYYANKPSQLGYADGTAANNTNTGGAAGSDLGTSVTSNGGSIIYQDGAWLFRRGPSSSSSRFDKTVDTSVRYSVEATFELPSAVTTESRVIMFATGTGYAGILTITNSSFLRIYDSANQTVYTSTTPVTTGKFRVQVGIERSTDNTDGKVRLNAFLGSNYQGTTPDITFTSNTENTGIELISSIRTGHVNSVNGGHDLMLVDWQADSTKITGSGPLQAGSPTATIQTGPQSYAIVDARNSVSGGGVLTYGISPTAKTQELTPGLWAIERGSTDQSYTVTVTDGTSNSTDSEVVTVSPSSSSAEGYTQTLIRVGGVWQ